MRLRLLLAIDTEITDQEAHEELGTVDPETVARELSENAEGTLRREGARAFGRNVLNASAAVVPLLEASDIEPHVPSLDKAHIVQIDGVTWRRGPDELWYMLR